MTTITFDRDEMPRRGSTVELQRRIAVGAAEMVTLQTYKLVKWAAHEARDGARSAIMTWRTECMTCGADFNFTTGLSTRALIRRCPACRRTAKRPLEGWPNGPRNKHVYYPAPELELGGLPPDRDHETELKGPSAVDMARAASRRVQERLAERKAPPVDDIDPASLF